MLPANVEVTKTRDYGYTADEKSTELIFHMGLATLSVVLLMAFALGRREAVVVAVAVPVTLALTLASSYLFGYTLNRVTLFALIFAIGILVDDAIVVVENIHRHFQLGWGEPRQATVFATDEVGNPTILATFTVIAALLPLAFVSGLMGPYMRPIPINASAAMLFSLLVAFVVSPWLTFRLFRKYAEEHAAQAAARPGRRRPPEEDRLHRFYARLIAPLLRARVAALGAARRRWRCCCSPRWRWSSLRVVTVKMLPYDNKSEFQVVVDMPEGYDPRDAPPRSPARWPARCATLPEVTDIQIYVGTSAPFNFNGLVRHYFLRSGPHVADIQVNLVPKHDRDAASHAFAKHVRALLAADRGAHGANVKVTEVPPGPPVLSTMVAEIYGPDARRSARRSRGRCGTIFETHAGHRRRRLVRRGPGAASSSSRSTARRRRAPAITPEMIARTLRVALGRRRGRAAARRARRATPVPIVLRLDRAQRSSVAGLLAITRPRRRAGGWCRSRELVHGAPTAARAVHLPQEPAAGDLRARRRWRAPRRPGLRHPRHEGPDRGAHGPGRRAARAALARTCPTTRRATRLKWDGEWQITYEVFRDMGIAFAVVLLLIYVLVVGWFRSFVTPLIIMAPIPLTLIGILPAHGLGGMFFTATSMIGFIALAGIIVRNSILLVDFINLELRGRASRSRTPWSRPARCASGRSC